jgi:hypothetical protein
MCLLSCLRIVAWAKPAYFIDDGRLRSEPHGFSLPVPAGWGQGITVDAPALLARLIRDKGRAELRIVVHSATEQTFPSPQQVEKDLVSAVRGFQIKEVKPLTLGGAKFQEYRATGSAGARVYSLFFGFANARSFLFLLECNTEDAEKARNELMTSLKAIQFFEPKEKAPAPAGAIEAS